MAKLSALVSLLRGNANVQKEAGKLDDGATASRNAKQRRREVTSLPRCMARRIGASRPSQPDGVTASFVQDDGRKRRTALLASAQGIAPTGTSADAVSKPALVIDAVAAVGAGQQRTPEKSFTPTSRAYDIGITARTTPLWP